MLLVQRFADLALSTLRLVLVAQQCGVTEPGEEKKKKQQNKTVEKNVNKAATEAGCSECYECFRTLLSLSNSFLSARVSKIMNLMNLSKLKAETGS